MNQNIRKTIKAKKWRHRTKRVVMLVCVTLSFTWMCVCQFLCAYSSQSTFGVDPATCKDMAPTLKNLQGKTDNSLLCAAYLDTKFDVYEAIDKDRGAV